MKTFEELLAKFSCLASLEPEFIRNKDGVYICTKISFYWVHRGDTKKRLSIHYATAKTTQECVKQLDEYLETFETENVFLYEVDYEEKV